MAKSKSPSKYSKSPKRSPKKSPKSSKRSKSPKRSPSSKSAYCLRCKKNVKITGCKVSKTSKGQPMIKGKCSICGTKVNRFIKM